MSKRAHMTAGMLPNLRKCECGHVPQMQKDKNNRYYQYQVVCQHCGRHTLTCSTAAYATKLWNMKSYLSAPPTEGSK